MITPHFLQFVMIRTTNLWLLQETELERQCNKDALKEQGQMDRLY